MDVVRQNQLRRFTLPAGLPFVGQVYTLTAEELQQCLELGKRRDQENKISGTKNCNYSQRNDVDINVQGLIGEMAFGKMLGRRRITTLGDITDTTCRNWQNDTFDGLLTDFGLSVDVKTTFFDQAPIRVTAWKKRRPAHLFALMIIENRHYSLLHLPRVSFRGAVFAETLFRPENTYTCQGHPYYTLPQSQLVGLDHLLGGAKIINHNNEQPNPYHVLKKE
jgi:hypothetical protein